MSRSTQSRWSVCAVAVACVACGDPAPTVLPPLGEVVVSVDTDAPVPELVGRLRVDVFSNTGQWLESRDVLRADAQSWPASFSVYTEDTTHEASVILRVRAYTEGRTRRYEGEQFAGEPFVEPPVARSLTELCEDAPELELGKTLTLRRGRGQLTSATLGDDCLLPETNGGAVAARLTVANAGRYRIEAVHAFPLELTTLLMLRRDCLDHTSQIACNSKTLGDTLEGGDYLAHLEVELEPGTYTILALGYMPTPIDITLKADLASAWRNDEPSEPEPPAPLPRLLRSGVDDTPDEEPEPQLTIDRLARIRITPGRKQLATLTLHAQCVGTMARLSNAGSFADLVPSEAATCIDREGQRRPLADEELTPFERLPTATRINHFALEEPCERQPPDASAACVPGGEFVFGTASVTSTIGRFAVLHRFWMDRDEVTVERWREVRARGFVPTDATPTVNDLRYVTSIDDPVALYCTYSTRPLPGEASRERFPVTCVSWYDARAFCQFEGGDLPTEAQWEYAAIRAGRAQTVMFPWSADLNETVDCDSAVYGRHPSFNVKTCGDMGFGVASIDDPVYAHDTTPLGLRALGGSVSEWTLDAWAPTLASGCWRNATIADPLCWEREAPSRAFRGGSAFDRPADLLGGNRHNATPLGTSISSLGFRCVYKEAR